MTITEALEGTQEDRRSYAEEKISGALEVIREAMHRHFPKGVFGLMSGGDDSLPASYIASLSEGFAGILHINTETGIPQTSQHVRDICAQRKWRLFERRPSEFIDAKGIKRPISYREMVLQNGFPGAAQHTIMYQMLKQRQIDCFERQYKFEARSGHYAMYISGARSQESARRSRNVTDETKIRREGRRIWVAAIEDWTRLDCEIVRDYAKLPRNPVAGKIGMSGECLCGAYAHTGELDQIGRFFPEKAEEIRRLEKEVMSKFPWKWEANPPKRLVEWNKFKKEQLRKISELNQELCVSCNKLGRS